jgi:PHD/YefM family antitoxin component YafN of YafNO toxin-antitoxin module
VAIIVRPDEFDGWEETLAISTDAELMAKIRRGLEDLKKNASCIFLRSYSPSERLA